MLRHDTFSEEHVALPDVMKMRVASKVWFSVVVRCASLLAGFLSGCASVARCALRCAQRSLSLRCGTPSEMTFESLKLWNFETSGTLKRRNQETKNKTRINKDTLKLRNFFYLKGYALCCWPLLASRGCHLGGSVTPF